MSDLQYLIDRANITDVISNLAHSQDERDWDAFVSLFTDRVKFDLSEHLNLKPQNMTVEELKDKTQKALTGFESTQHISSDVVITVDGDTAQSRNRMTAYHHLPTEPGIADHCIMRGYWHLSLRRIDGRWLITRVRVVRTSPFDGYAGLYGLAAEAATAQVIIG